MSTHDARVQERGGASITSQAPTEPGPSRVTNGQPSPHGVQQSHHRPENTPLDRGDTVQGEGEQMLSAPAPGHAAIENGNSNVGLNQDQRATHHGIELLRPDAVLSRIPFQTVAEKRASEQAATETSTSEQLNRPVVSLDDIPPRIFDANLPIHVPANIIDRTATVDKIRNNGGIVTTKLSRASIIIVDEKVVEEVPADLVKALGDARLPPLVRKDWIAACIEQGTQLDYQSEQFALSKTVLQPTIASTAATITRAKQAGSDMRVPYTHEDRANIIAHLAATKTPWRGVQCARELEERYGRHTFLSYLTHLRDNLDQRFNYRSRVQVCWDSLSPAALDTQCNGTAGQAMRASEQLREVMDVDALAAERSEGSAVDNLAAPRIVVELTTSRRAESSLAGDSSQAQSRPVGQEGQQEADFRESEGRFRQESRDPTAQQAIANANPSSSNDAGSAASARPEINDERRLSVQSTERLAASLAEWLVNSHLGDKDTLSQLPRFENGSAPPSDFFDHLATESAPAALWRDAYTAQRDSFHKIAELRIASNPSQYFSQPKDSSQDLKGASGATYNQESSSEDELLIESDSEEDVTRAATAAVINGSQEAARDIADAETSQARQASLRQSFAQTDQPVERQVQTAEGEVQTVDGQVQTIDDQVQATDGEAQTIEEEDYLIAQKMGEVDVRDAETVAARSNSNSAAGFGDSRIASPSSDRDIALVPNGQLPHIEVSSIIRMQDDEVASSVAGHANKELQDAEVAPEIALPRIDAYHIGLDRLKFSQIPTSRRFSSYLAARRKRARSTKNGDIVEEGGSTSSRASSVTAHPPKALPARTRTSSLQRRAHLFAQTSESALIGAVSQSSPKDAEKSAEIENDEEDEEEAESRERARKLQQRNPELSTAVELAWRFDTSLGVARKYLAAAQGDKQIAERFMSLI